MERKEIVKVLGEHFGVKPKYMGVPSFAYQIETADETYSVDRVGKITTLDGNEVELETLLDRDKAEEIMPITTESITTESIAIEVSVPVEGHTGVTLNNLVNMIYCNQVLIKKSFGITDNIIEDDFCIGINKIKPKTLSDFKSVIENMSGNYCSRIAFDFINNMIIFKFLDGEESVERVKAYTEFVALLNQKAKALLHTCTKAKVTNNEKYTFRIFLMRLGMLGDEYKMARKILLKNLEGNSAFRSGKKPEKVKD